MRTIVETMDDGRFRVFDAFGRHTLPLDGDELATHLRKMKDGVIYYKMRTEVEWYSFLAEELDEQQRRM